MEARLLEHAIEFCKLVAKADLLDYLGLTPQSTPDEVREALARRRRYMQGMQSNPKYATEARAFIKSFGDFQTLLQDPAAYAAATARRRESTHLPVLELTIKSALKGGAPTLEQIDFLRRNANELGVGEETFVDVLDRLARDAGVSLAQPAGAKPPPAARRTSTGGQSVQAVDITERHSLASLDHYAILGVPRDVDDAGLHAAYQVRSRRARDSNDAMLKGRVELAFRVLSDPEQRRSYDLSRTTTGPPARDREHTDPRAEVPAAVAAMNAPSTATAPPVRPRTVAARREDAPRLAFTGEAVRTVTGSDVTHVDVDLQADPDDATPPRLTTDQPWAALVDAPRPGVREQRVRVRIDLPALTGPGRAQIAAVNDRGERAVLIVDAVPVAKRAFPWLTLAGGVVFVAGLAALAAVLSQPAPHPKVEILVEPRADHVRVGDRDLGPGDRFVVELPAAAPLAVEATGFRTYQGTLTSPGPARVVLDPTLPLDAIPAADAVRGSLPEAEVAKAIAPRRDAIHRCFAGATRAMTGTIRIFVDTSGAPTGVTLDGDGAGQPAILACVRRQVAALRFPAVVGGQYATVRYDYAVNPEKP